MTGRSSLSLGSGRAAARKFFPENYPWVGTAALARLAGRYPGGQFYEDLARLATSGRLTADELVAVAAGRLSAAGISLDARRLAWFGSVTASRVESATRYDDVANILDLAYRTGGKRIFVKQLDLLWFQALHLAGRLDDRRAATARAIAPADVRWAVDTDALYVDVDTGSPSAEWLTALNIPYLEAGLEPVAFDGDGPTLFDRLTSTAPTSRMDGQPLVSVVMPVFNPDESLRTAVRSLLAQTWSHMEILLCDDGSTAGNDLFQDLSELDPRIRVLRAGSNQGAYAARNLGIGESRGDFVTFNDADDWSHPRRIERQVVAMLQDPAVLATVSQSIRSTEDVRLTALGYGPRRANLSSLMLRRLEMQEHLGGFDVVRRAGDTEFFSRMRAVLGPDCLLEVEAPLAMVQLTADSLSRADIQLMRMHPARRQYVANLHHWHREVVAGRETGYLAPGTRAPFPAPAHIIGSAVPARSLDVLMLANLGVGSATIVDLAAEVAQLNELGLTVGLLEYLGPFDATARVELASGRLADLLRFGAAVRILPDEQVHVRVAIVRDPAAVEAMPTSVFTAITADRTVIVADYAPSQAHRYDAEAVTDLVGRTSGEVRWLPATDAIADELRPLRGDEQLLHAHPFGCVSPVRIGEVSAMGHLRIGISLGSGHTVPRADIVALLSAVLPTQRDIEVVLWDMPRGVSENIARPVLTLSPSVASRQEFIQQIDILLVAAAHGRGSHLDPNAVTAMAAGKIVIFDPVYRSHFGDAGLYLDEATSDDWLDLLAVNPARYAEQQRRSAGFVQRQLSPQSFETVLASVLNVTAPEA